MKVTVFTSNQPRHINLINTISEFAEETYAIVETNTLFPGLVQDFFNSTATMQEYMASVRKSEGDLFGKSRFINPNVNTLVMKSGDLHHLTWEDLNHSLRSDVYVVFGSSFIKGWLIDYLIDNKALNIHMGLSPYYRGSSCNFWALFDSNPNYVGATIHFLSKGLDSGPIIFHSVPEFNNESPFTFTMKAVKQAQEDLIHFIQDNKDLGSQPIIQDGSLQVRYTRNSDFTDAVAREFLERDLSPAALGDLLVNTVTPSIRKLM